MEDADVQQQAGVDSAAAAGAGRPLLPDVLHDSRGTAQSSRLVGFSNLRCDLSHLCLHLRLRPAAYGFNRTGCS